MSMILFVVLFHLLGLTLPSSVDVQAPAFVYDNTAASEEEKQDPDDEIEIEIPPEPLVSPADSDR